MPHVASTMVVLLHLLLLFETALVFGFTPPECHMWKKKLGLFLLFRLFLLRLKSATVVFLVDSSVSPQNSCRFDPIYYLFLDHCARQAVLLLLCNMLSWQRRCFE